MAREKKPVHKVVMTEGKRNIIKKMAEKIVRPILTYADECHHAASASSMDLLRKVKAKYVYGVSATPKRGKRWHDR